MKTTYIVQKSDIGKGGSIMHRGMFEPLGIVQKRDVGKMLVLNGDVWQVENEQQFKQRTKNAKV
jgi:hypothetical protein